MSWVLKIRGAESVFAAGLAAIQSVLCGLVHSEISVR